MTIVDRLTPDSDIKATLETLLMPIIAAVTFLVLWIILNLIDGDDDMMVRLPNDTGFVLVAVLLAFWIGIVAVNDGGNIGDALVGAAVFGLLYGLLLSLFQEVFFSEIVELTGNGLETRKNKDLFLDGYFGKSMILAILSSVVLFVMVAFVGAGLAEDMLVGVEEKPAKTEKSVAAKADKAPAAKTTAKKRTTKKVTKAVDD